MEMKQSIIARKISKKLFIIYIGIYCFILLLLISILSPFLYRTAVARGAESLAVITDEFRILQESMSDFINIFHLETELNQLILNYHENPDRANRERINLELNKYLQTNQKVLAICLEDDRQNFFSTNSFSSVNKQALLHQNAKYTAMLALKNSSCFSPVITGEFRSMSIPYDCFSYSKNISIGSHTYIVSIFYNANAVLDHCIQMSQNNFSSFAVINRYQDLLFYSEEGEFYAEITGSVTNVRTSAGYFKDQGGQVFYQVIPSTNCTVIAYAPFSQLYANAVFIIGAVTLLYLLSPVLYMMFLLPTTRQQLKPLKQLSLLMTSYRAGDAVTADINTDDEIGQLSNSFNQMVVEINQSIREIEKREHENSVISYKLLATQIDPHFIYNTMNIINIMAKDGNHAAVIEINSALIKILRERLNTKITVYETIKNEIDTMMQYCLIAAYRYENHVSVRFDIDETLEECLIPKNILQPLVENAFFHGFPQEQDIGNGCVDILIYAVDEEIIIEVSDNGQGMSEERIKEILENSYTIYNDKKPHIGINNIRQRLDYLYSGKYDFQIQSAVGQGTTIVITIPSTCF